MTKKAAKKGNAMSLKDFYESAPGKLPLETRLPSKPGELKRDNESHFRSSHANIDDTCVGNFGVKGKGSYSRSYVRPSSGLIGVGHGYDQYISARPDNELYQPARQPNRFHPTSPSLDVADQHSNRPYFMQPPPPPPPRRPSSPVAQRQPSPPPRRQPSPPKAAQPTMETIISTGPFSAGHATPGLLLSAPKTAVQTISGPIRTPSSAAEKTVETVQPAMREQSSAPKNLWAEKMAQQALERMASAKSSLLADPPLKLVTPATSVDESRTVNTTLVKPDQPITQRKLSLNSRLVSFEGPQVPANTPAAAAPALFNSTPQEERPKLNLPCSKPVREAEAADDAGRPRVNLQPRTPEPVEDTGRPRVQLQPRTKPVQDTQNKKDSSSAKSRSIFGDARPREEVLKQRGVDVVALESDRLDRMSHSSAAAGSNSRPSSRAASVGSGFSEDESWHTVSNRKQSKLQQVNGSVLGHSEHSNVNNDFIFGSSVSSNRAVGFMASDSDAVYGGSYGSPKMYNLGGDVQHEDDGPIFRRSLPTRAGSFF